MVSTDCEWLGIPLRSPFILASLTLFSKPNVQKHIEYFTQAAHYGVGAIVLPSIHPLRKDESSGNPHVRTVPIASGLHGTVDYMGFAVLGTTDNIVSIDYGVNLASEAVKIGVPVLASIANIGSKNDFINAVQKIVTVNGLAGIELNFSCPNVLNGLSLDVSLLEDVFTVSHNLPITIKLAPQTDFSAMLQNRDLFSGITCSNAYTGLIPPDLKKMTPFGDAQFWRPTGIYGPQEKLLTFYDIWKFKSRVETKDIPLSSVGGFVSPSDVIQAIMLGTDTVQLSSAVIWKGLKIIQDCNEELKAYLKENKLTLKELKGSSLTYIKFSDTDLNDQRPVRTMYVDNKKCRNCPDCACFEHGCYAFKKTQNNCAEIDKELCNGCGWCQILCFHHAIKEKE